MRTFPLYYGLVKISWLIILSNATSNIKHSATVLCCCRSRNLCRMARKWYFTGKNLQVIKDWNNKILFYDIRLERRKEEKFINFITLSRDVLGFKSDAKKPEAFKQLYWNISMNIHNGINSPKRPESLISCFINKWIW